MANVSNAIQRAAAAPAARKQNAAAASVAEMVGQIVDREGYRRRFDELLGRRAPQFIASIVSLINTTPDLQKAFAEAPLTVIQAALKAAIYDLPIDPQLGYAYIVAFNNYDKSTGTKRMEAGFILGYKGMLQLALRTGVYKVINVVDVRDGEFVRYNRLTEDMALDFVEDDDEREKLPIVGWAGYYRLLNGMVKTLYMTRAQVEAHERRHRKGPYQTKGWREDFDEMAQKTVLRRLIGKWGLMSIDYQRQTDPAAVAAATAIATGTFDDEDALPDVLPGEIAESQEDAGQTAE